MSIRYSIESYDLNVQTEGGLQEEEIMTHIMHEVLQSNPEDKENEKCAICQVRPTIYIYMFEIDSLI